MHSTLVSITRSSTMPTATRQEISLQSSNTTVVLDQDTVHLFSLERSELHLECGVKPLDQTLSQSKSRPLIPTRILDTRMLSSHMERLFPRCHLLLSLPKVRCVNILHTSFASISSLSHSYVFIIRLMHSSCTTNT